MHLFFIGCTLKTDVVEFIGNCQSLLYSQIGCYKLVNSFDVWHKDCQRISLPYTLAPTAAFNFEDLRRVGKGISAQASHRTVREALTSYGSSCSKNSGYYSLIILNSVIPLLIMVVFVNSNEQAKPFAPFPLQKLRHYYDLVRHPYQLRY